MSLGSPYSPRAVGRQGERLSTGQGGFAKLFSTSGVISKQGVIMLMECQCASNPFLCTMPVLSVFMVHSSILVILGHMDEYLNFQAGIFPVSGDVVGMLRRRTKWFWPQLWCRAAGRLWQTLPWWFKLSVSHCPSHAGVGGCCSAEESLEGEMLVHSQKTGIVFLVISCREQSERHPLTLLPAALALPWEAPVRRAEKMLVQDR